MLTNKSGKKLFLLSRIFLLFISLIILTQILDLKLVLYYLKSIPLTIVVILIAIALFRAWLTGLRWSLVNPDLSGQLTRWHYFRYTMIGHTFNLVMPGALGGDFARTAITVGTVKSNRAENVIAIIIDRFIGLLSILILGLLAVILAPDLPIDTSFYGLFAVFLLIVITFVVITNSALINFLERKCCGQGRLGSLINRVLQAWKGSLQYFKAHKNKVLLAFLLCLPIHTIAFISKYLLARSLGIDISFFSICLITSLVWLITAIPITISGAGIRELSMVYLFSLYDVAAEEATALSVYTYIISLMIGLFGVFFILDWGKVLGIFKKRPG